MKKDRDKYLFESPKERAKREAELEGEVSHEGYFLSEPIDLFEFNELIRNGTATERHHDEFYLRLLQHFVDRVYAREAPENWVMNALTDAFIKVLQGERWEDALPLPWTKMTLPHTAAEWQALGIFCDVTKAIKSNTDAEVTAVIRDVASARNVSYESARAAYYKHKHLI
jgi:hypothetical protein